MKKHTSDFIFTLADKYQIPLDSSKPAEFLDESYYGFCQEYLEQCKTRDINLKQHLEDITIGNVKAVWTISHDNFNMKHLSLLFEKSGYMYIVYLASQKDFFDKNLSQFKEVVFSFRFIN